MRCENGVSSLAGCGSAWLERLVWDQEVAGSNPVTPRLRSNPRKLIQKGFTLPDAERPQTVREKLNDIDYAGVVQW